jgi:hypothetical protein
MGGGVAADAAAGAIGGHAVGPLGEACGAAGLIAAGAQAVGRAAAKSAASEKDRMR